MMPAMMATWIVAAAAVIDRARRKDCPVPASSGCAPPFHVMTALVTRLRAVGLVGLLVEVAASDLEWWPS
jgi:hypothetical protein